jgi:hypothetical protein
MRSSSDGTGRSTQRFEKRRHGVPRTPGPATATAPERAHAARYECNSTSNAAARFEPPQDRVRCAAGCARKASRSRQRSCTFARMRDSSSSAEAVGMPARCSIRSSRSRASIWPRMRSIELGFRSGFGSVNFGEGQSTVDSLVEIGAAAWWSFLHSSCGGRCRPLCWFLDAGNQEAPHAQLTGVQKAPRHEVAGSWAPAKQRAL